MSEHKPLFFKTFLLVLVILLANIGFLLYQYGGLNPSLSGFSVTNLEDSVLQTYTSIPKSSTIFLIVEWSFFILLLIGIFVRDKIVLSKDIKRLNLSSKRKRYRTDLDVLYELLKEKKTIKISTIARAFKIDKDKAMEWAKILESGDLVTIEYPGFRGEPEVRIAQKNKKRGLNEKQEKETEEEPLEKEKQKSEKQETTTDKQKTKSKKPKKNKVKKTRKKRK